MRHANLGTFDLAFSRGSSELMDDFVRTGRVDAVFDIFAVFKSRAERQMEFALKQLDEEPDFTLAERYYFDREDSPWAADEDELELLTSRGHDVTTFTKSNRDFKGTGNAIRVALGTPWNWGAASELSELVRKTGADVVHFHNTFPLISPAAIRVASSAGGDDTRPRSMRTCRLWPPIVWATTFS